MVFPLLYCWMPPLLEPRMAWCLIPLLHPTLTKYALCSNYYVWYRDAETNENKYSAEQEIPEDRDVAFSRGLV